MAPVRAAFVMEQTLGHVTHSQNLRTVAAEQSAVAPTWLPVPFDVRGPACLVPILRSNWSLRASWRARRALDAALAQQPHDAVVFHTQVTSLFSIGTMRRLPTIVSLDATPINYDSIGQHYNHRPAGTGPLDFQKYQLNRRAFHAATALVSWSEWAKRSLVDDYGVDENGVRVLAPGAAPAFFDIGSRRLAGDAESADRGPVRVLFVGGDFARKGGPMLLESMQDFLADGCELDLVTTAAVEPRPNVRVHRGLAPNSPELLRLFEEADLFVLPSYADCLAMVLMEASAAGLPIITTRVGALGEAVHLNESGLLVPAGDPRALRDALVTLVADTRLRKRMGRASFALARHKFDARKNNLELLDLVAEVARPDVHRVRSAA